MAKPFRFGSAVSLVALAAMIAGCATPHRDASRGFGGKANGEIGLATRALAALNANDFPTAIAFRRAGGRKTPDDAGFRALLGNAYFAGGRFASAEAPTRIRSRIYPNQPQVVLKLALVEIAQGKNARSGRASSTPAGPSSIRPITALRWRLPASPTRRSRCSSRRPARRAPTPASARTSRWPMRFAGDWDEGAHGRRAGRSRRPARRAHPAVDAARQAGARVRTRSPR